MELTAAGFDHFRDETRAVRERPATSTAVSPDGWILEPLVQAGRGADGRGSPGASHWPLWESGRTGAKGPSSVIGGLCSLFCIIEYWARGGRVLFLRHDNED